MGTGGAGGREPADALGRGRQSRRLSIGRESELPRRPLGDAPPSAVIALGTPSNGERIDANRPDTASSLYFFLEVFSFSALSAAQRAFCAAAMAARPCADSLRARRLMTATSAATLGRPRR